MKTATVLFALLLLATTQASANGDPPARRGVGRPPAAAAGNGRAMSQAVMPACAMYLMHAHPGALKNRLGLNDQQLVEIEKSRTGFLADRIRQKSQIEQNQVKMAELFRAEPPDEDKILDLERKTLALRDAIAERGVKTYVKLLQTLDKSQRAELRSQCSSIASQAMGRMGWMGTFRRREPMEGMAGAAGWR